MARKHGSNNLLESENKLPEELQAAMQLVGDGKELIPVQLPESPTDPQNRSPEEPSLSKSPINARSIELVPPMSPRSVHRGSPLDVFRQPNVCLESPGSPRSDFSRNSDESVIIVGDTFSAPMHLQFSVDGSSHVRDAGAFDRYSLPMSQPLSMSASWRQDDPSPSLNSTPPVNPRRPLPSPPPLPELGSPFSLRSPQTRTFYIESPSISPITRPKVSPTGPRPIKKCDDSWEPGAKASRWRKKKRREELESLMGLSSSGIGLSPPRLGGSQDWTRRQSTPQLLSDHGLNPFATSFCPTATWKERAHSLPDMTALEPPPLLPNLQSQHTGNVYPPHSLQSANLDPINSETLANIEQDLLHLRQWSSLFQMQSFTFPEYRNYSQNTQLQSSLQPYQHHLWNQQQRHPATSYQQQNHGHPYYQQEGRSIMATPSREGFGTLYTLPSAAQALPTTSLHEAERNLQPYHVQGSQATDSRCSSLVQLQLGGYSGSSESSTSTPHSAATDLPLDILTQVLTEIQLPEIQLPIPIRHSPLVQGGGSTSGSAAVADAYVEDGISPPGSKVGPRLRQQSRRSKPVDAPSTPVKNPANTLTARGKSSLTPVTELSEISTPNASTSSSSQPNKKVRRLRRPRKPKSDATAAANCKNGPETAKKA